MAYKVFDDVANHCELAVSGYYDATATQVTFEDATGHPDAPCNATWWDRQNYERPRDDPNMEIVRVIAWNGNVATLENAAGARVPQEGTAASAKNTSGGVYVCTFAPTKKFFGDLDDALVNVGSAYAWITEHGGVGDGATDDTAAFEAAIAAGRTCLIVPSGTWVFEDSVEFPVTMTLFLLPGAVLAPIVSADLDILGDVVAGNWAWQGGAGNINLTTRCPVRRKRWSGTDSDAVEVHADLEVIGADVEIRGARVTFGSAAPATGTWAVGDVCLNSAPSTGEPIGWRCTTAGTPGTWEELPLSGGLSGLSFGTAAPATGTHAKGETVLNSEPDTGEPIGWRCTTAGTPGTWETLRKGTELKFYDSAEIDLDTAWNAATEYEVNIAHGEGTPPSLDDLVACTFFITQGDPATAFGSRDIYVKSIDATNIVVYVYPNSVPASTYGKIRVVFRVP